MSSNLHIAWARLLVGALHAAGVRDAVVSPGSRSTPLVVALAESALRVHVVIDERVAAFFALGQARATGRPSVLVCTSGTAGAHYYPAIVEASLARLPVVAVTADRPWELAHASAAQTIDQTRLFGAFVRFAGEIGVPDASPGALRGVARLAAQAVAASLGPEPGPVHLDAHFRKPLEPVAMSAPEVWEAEVERLLDRGPSRVVTAKVDLDAASVAPVAARIAAASRGVIVAGPQALLAAEDRAAAFELARHTGFPLLAEATSQLRFGLAPAGVVRVGALDLVLRSPRARAALRPDLAICLGAPPTSTGFAELAASGVSRVVIAPHGWNDPWNDAETLVAAPVAVAARALSALLPRRAPDGGWTARWRAVDAMAAAAVEEAIVSEPLVEGQIARVLVGACPEGALLAVGNSSPVRDVDLFCPPGGRAIDVLHQRGASGIDGLVAGAVGARAASGRPTALLVGDVSLAHDLGALALLREPGSPLVVVVVDNHGGRIFETLPVARRVAPAVMDRFFATPPEIDWERAAGAFGVAFSRVSTRGALAAALGEAFARDAATLVHAVVPPGDAAERNARARAAFDAALAARTDFEHRGDTT